MVKKNYYSILELSRDENEEGIKKAYRKLALLYHPDRKPGDKAAEEKFKEISEAYAVLGDSNKRRDYDRYGHIKFHQRYRREDIFDGYVSRSFFCRRRGGPRCGMGGFLWCLNSNKGRKS